MGAPTGELSLGLARRAALARAFAVEPDLLVLDEPFVSLDEATASRLRRLLLRTWQARPVTALMVTHNIQEAILLASTSSTVGTAAGCQEDQGQASSVVRFSMKA